MEFKGNNGKNLYTLTVKDGKVQSILVEIQDSYERVFYQRGPVKLGLTMNEMIFEEAVMAICKRNLIYWMELYETIKNDEEYGLAWLMKIFEKHLI